MTEPAPAAIALLVRAAATLASPDGVGVDYVDVQLRADGPTRAQLEAVLGPAHELPRIPGPAFHRLSFRGPEGSVHVSLFADIDDETGRATSLMARRDELG
jgi:hypothetical protein